MSFFYVIKWFHVCLFVFHIRNISKNSKLLYILKYIISLYSDLTKLRLGVEVSVTTLIASISCMSELQVLSL